MDIKELFSMAKAANTKAQIKILMSEDAVCIRWIYDHAFGPEWSRNLPMSALGNDRDPYRAVREYIKMDALYMEGRGGTPDRTHSLFQTTAPASAIKPMRGPKIPPMRMPSAQVSFVHLRSPYLSLHSIDLLPGDVVKSTGHWPDKTVDSVENNEKGYIVNWRSGGSTRYNGFHVHEVVRK